MSPGKTLSRYIALRFLAWCSAIFGTMVIIIFLLDYIDLIRRGATRPGATLLVLLEMAALKQPYMAQQILPFTILFGTMLLFWRMTRSNELVIARAAGVSAWQFLAPSLVVAFVIGAISVTVFNPIASILQARYENLEARTFHSNFDKLMFSNTGFWLRQSDETGAAAVIHAERMQMPETRLENVTVLTFVNDTHLVGRIDAASAALEDGKWRISDGARWSPGRPPAPFEEYDLPTNLTSSKI